MTGINGTLGLFLAPFFLFMIIVEVWIGNRRGLQLYTPRETLASLSIAVGQRVIGLLPIGTAGIVSMWVWDRRVYEVDLSAWWAIPVLFIGTEFTYYWFHRMSHEVRWFWATHSVHHTIEEMNILGAYRLGWTGMIAMGFLFHMPLVWLGYPPLAVGTMLALNLFYQSWLHTLLIPKLGVLEGILNTPSSHRVHHARNADYLDRNHGGVTVVFDRVFGTYVEEREDEPVEFGLVKPLRSSNPIKIVFHEWVAIFHDLRRYNVQHWIGLLFGPPGWLPNGMGMTSAKLRASYLETKGLSKTISLSINSPVAGD